MERTIYCGALTSAHLGQRHTVCGFVETVRDMGGVIFIDLYDKEGELQVVCNRKALSAAEFQTAETARPGFVLAVSGNVRPRGPETYNEHLKTGALELAAGEISLLASAAPLPLTPDLLGRQGDINEALRLKYRYLDLRRPAMQENLHFRHQVLQVVRSYLDGEGFTEVETPILTKSTPEGARDFLVPSRQKSAFYALPQSPQLFKQLLMVGGLDKYYQVARCFRDEDLRADRQPEFTQVDMELSFVSQENILQMLEGLFRHLLQAVRGLTLPPIPRLSWQMAMELYGSDKPDLRFSMPILPLSEAAEGSGFAVFDKVLAAGGRVSGLCVEGASDWTRSDIEHLTEKAVSLGAAGMAWISFRPDGEIYSLLTKFMKPEALARIAKASGAKPGDFLLFCTDRPEIVLKVLGELRLEAAGMRGLLDKSKLCFAFVTDFPQFEYAAEEARFVAAHHPFTMPHADDLPLLESDPAAVRAQAYDLVLNGVELGSGSIRIHDSALQRRMLSALGYSKEEAGRRFGFLLEALSYGAPPHGGFAFGLDRLCMLLLGLDSIREVIAFPKNRAGACPLTGAPGTAEPSQLSELGLSLKADSMYNGQGKVQPPHRNTPDRKEKPMPDLNLAKIAALAKLSIPKERAAAVSDGMQTILGFAAAIEASVLTPGESAEEGGPLASLRTDEEIPSLSHADLFSNAPAEKDGFFFVPPVFAPRPEGETR